MSHGGVPPLGGQGMQGMMNTAMGAIGKMAPQIEAAVQKIQQAIQSGDPKAMAAVMKELGPQLAKQAMQMLRGHGGQA